MAFHALRAVSNLYSSLFITNRRDSTQVTKTMHTKIAIHTVTHRKKTENQLTKKNIYYDRRRIMALGRCYFFTHSLCLLSYITPYNSIHRDLKHRPTLATNPYQHRLL